MNRDLLEVLCCPDCHGDLTLDDAGDGGAIEFGTLWCKDCAAAYPIRTGIPRFVPAENYASTFGLQWNRFPRTQLDSNSGVPISRNRFFATSGWTDEELNGRRVLDVGCGSGRFAEVALGAGARLVAVDYSAAVDACAANLAGPGRDFVQADIDRLPFRESVFDFVYCIGVLQHTPDPDRAFRSLLPPLRPAGKIAVDVYPKTWMNMVWPKYWLRPITKRIRPARLFAFVQWMVPALLPLSRALGRIPVAGRKLRWLIPVANYEGIHPLNEQQLREWAVLDTFDMLSPAHDHPRSRAELHEWIKSAGLQQGEVLKAGHLVARGVKSAG
jgi:SAM-dependent methyltransferase